MPNLKDVFFNLTGSRRHNGDVITHRTEEIYGFNVTVETLRKNHNQADAWQIIEDSGLKDFLFAVQNMGVDADISLRLFSNDGSLAYHQGHADGTGSRNKMFVDLSNPITIVHEYGHLLDFDNGYSHSPSFKNLFLTYAEQVRPHMSTLEAGVKGHAFESFSSVVSGDALTQVVEQQWSDYKSYLLSQEEVFARCFQQYIVDIMPERDYLVDKDSSEFDSFAKKAYKSNPRLFRDFFDSITKDLVIPIENEQFNIIEKDLVI